MLFHRCGVAKFAIYAEVSYSKWPLGESPDR